ncbi:IGL1 protein, partial [Serilophus lunatus]|nr:IGL1 protein [Serilophus lunatus]
MAWVPLLLAVLAHSSGSLVQAALSQPSKLSATVGETVKITCSGSSNSYYGWFQQKVPGNAPVTVIYSNDKRPSNIPSRFSGSSGTLTITGVQAEDEAVYYCGGYDSSIPCGTMPPTSAVVGEKGQTDTAPSVYLFPPSSEQTSKQNQATLVCLVENFYPRDVTVEWKGDGSVITDGVKTSVALQQSNRKYIASSYLTLSPSRWNSYNSVTCKVNHDAGTVEKTVNRSECS